MTINQARPTHPPSFVAEARIILAEIDLIRAIGQWELLRPLVEDLQSHGESIMDTDPLFESIQSLRLFLHENEAMLDHLHLQIRLDNLLKTVQRCLASYDNEKF